MTIVYSSFEARQLIAEKHNAYVDNVEIDITDKYVPPAPAYSSEGFPPLAPEGMNFLTQDALRVFWSEAIVHSNNRNPNRIALIKAIRTLLPGTSLKDAKDFVDSLLPF
jgi:hypothetical protein